MKVGVIDIGTLKVKLQIVEMGHSGQFKTIYQSNNLTCLGCHMEQNNGRPKEENLQKTLQELIRCKNILDELGVKTSRIVSTHAIREMGNVGSEIAKLIKNETQLNIEIISQKEEAELFFNAVFKDFKTVKDHLVIDVGGGSVQILIGNKDKLKTSFLLKTGTSTLWDKFTPHHNEMDFPKRKDVRKMKGYILAQLQPIPKNINLPIVYGSSCIIDLFKGIRLPMQKYSHSKSHPFKARVSDMSDFLDKVWSIPYDIREEKFISPTYRYMWGVDKAFLNVVELAKKIDAPYIIPSNQNIGNGLIQSLINN
ncbi:MAG: Ppx/GppA phosphatase [Microgenomates group bacterium GW2011_GWC1_37_8]|uniref:Ppx/GppA phosphatase n=2 Tax=Candidatus Woeseibacteriota TaxID=1752722 RepID=A0A0G0L4R5_9BACT|nr:MAG: Ppx/GppA phosphatase [Microgenomates group bacterium GW2011_GWC1_37_8]KKQ86022.1 MAG: Ppx/GppA phosphatase [Candidatus Woesebacteria bacterium GW2011_GWB1_38_8]OGM21841.1 MAG: hypothetical protein A2863_03800 [Candidatus Woesebacteria bacterium RIFCSPHIGHO2_01_FULL_38_9b]